MLSFAKRCSLPQERISRFSIWSGREEAYCEENYILELVHIRCRACLVNASLPPHHQRSGLDGAGPAMSCRCPHPRGRPEKGGLRTSSTGESARGDRFEIVVMMVTKGAARKSPAGDPDVCVRPFRCRLVSLGEQASYTRHFCLR
jgi:hypothetical protein